MLANISVNLLECYKVVRFEEGEIIGLGKARFKRLLNFTRGLLLGLIEVWCLLEAVMKG